MLSLYSGRICRQAELLPNNPKYRLPHLMSTAFLAVVSIFLLFAPSSSAEALLSFAVNGFRTSNAMSNITLSGDASFGPGFGNLVLTANASDQVGHGFYKDPIRFKTKDGKAISFSTTFIFSINCPPSPYCGHGFTFALSPTPYLNGSASADYLGLFNSSNDGKSSNHIVAVEFDTNKDAGFGESNDNHVGIDINSVRSNASNIPFYKEGNSIFNTSLKQPGAKEAWIEYDGPQMKLNVYLGDGLSPRPPEPVVSAKIDLARFLADETFIGFTAATGKKFLAGHEIMGWSFALNGTAEALKPPGPGATAPPTTSSGVDKLALVVPLVVGGMFLLLFIPGTNFLYVRRKRKFAELVEEWEVEYGPHCRLSYKELYRATGGFKDANFLGAGGFGKVYRGVLSSSGTEVAVKRVTHDTPQGTKEFVAEIVSMRQLRHRNLVQLLGYCRRKGELLLVYEFMPNGSLDGYLFEGRGEEAEKLTKTLSWEQRFDIIKGVASALLYLHEGWDQLVVHRDIKAANVLLDRDYNGKLGDFGLARLYDRGTNPRTTHVVGTLGYIAPELSMTGKATTSTDVYAFGAFLLEVACGRRPMEVEVLDSRNDLVLTNWVLTNWKKDQLLNVADAKLRGNYSVEQMTLVLRMGLLCSQLEPALRPNMRQVVQFLEGDAPLPTVSPNNLRVMSVDAAEHVGFSDISMSFPSTTTASSYASSAQPKNELLSPDAAFVHAPPLNSSCQPR